MPKVEDILQEIIAGRRMTPDEFRFLFNEADLYDLARAANAVRDRRFPEKMTTFVIDRNINYTNICSCKCRFCAFYRDKDDPDAYVIDEKLLYQKIDEALELGATQLMIQGGLNEDLDLAFFERMFRGIKERYNITIHSLTAPEVAFLARKEGLTLEQTLRRLRNAGLDSLPGGGAEILHDEVRAQISPNKISSREWLEVMRAAHREGMKSTATMMIGTVETLEHRLFHLQSIRNLQDETGGFRAFIVWTYQPGNNELMGEKMSSLEYLRFLALSRLFLDNFEHIQGSWVTQGKQIGQITQFFGADDLGSIMIEENVVRAAGLSYRMQIEEMIALIASAGRIPALRDTEYRIIKIFPGGLK
ncbi:MAG TPA: cyclic dehypoxanthinyl futalosine synthase [Syntrophomonadaceae bacterium]|nr:cyclic dehypoxanthinyl futalosine synthase [Syntrophomonadaceae bacterium]HPU49027.1 cyclic dehypoxanthinyl futalosine synthase [Syntrophomonadaceae bacterium]